MKCGQSIDFVMSCEEEYEDFFVCKKQRVKQLILQDLKIYNSIKKWEIL